MTDSNPPIPPATTELRREIYEISLRKINDIYYVPPGTSGSVGLTQEQLDRILALLTTHTNKAYKKGYIDGGIDEILRHENARKEVEQELEGGE